MSSIQLVPIHDRAAAITLDFDLEDLSEDLVLSKAPYSYYANRQTPFQVSFE
jgi:hypothetical protein